MRGFLALLRDALREAMDTKVFYVLAGFSVLFSVLCLGVGLETRSYEEALAEVFSEKRWGAAAVRMKGLAYDPVTPSEVAVFSEGGDTFDVRFRAEEVETFKVSVLAYSPTPAEALERSDLGDFKNLEGYRGFKIYLRTRLLQAGFVPRSIATLEEGLYEVRVAPMGAFETEGAQTLVLFFGLARIPLSTLGVSGADMVKGIETMFANQIGGWIGILVAVVVTAWFVPNMLRKGAVDLLLARPVPRWTVYVSRYFGGVGFVFFNAVVLVLGTWLALTVRTGYVHGGYLLTVVTITLLFAIVYSVSCLAGLVFRNAVLSIVFAVGFWFFCFLVNNVHALVESTWFNMQTSVPGAVKVLVKVVYYIFPSTTDLTQLNSYFMTLGSEGVGSTAVAAAMLEKIDFTGSIVTSLIFTAVVVAIGAWLFHRKEF